MAKRHQYFLPSFPFKSPLLFLARHLLLRTAIKPTLQSFDPSR